MKKNNFMRSIKEKNEGIRESNLEPQRTIPSLMLIHELCRFITISNNAASIWITQKFHINFAQQNSRGAFR